MAPSGSQNHSDQALILNKEVYRHVRQRRRRRQGDGSAQSQLEVQQIDKFDSSDTFGSAAAGTGKGIDYATTPFFGSPSPCPFILPL